MITLFQILQVGGLAGIISALFSGIVKEYFDWLGRKRKGRYLALKISLVLESYYHSCRNVANDINDHHNTLGEVGKNFVGLPKFEKYPEDSEVWIYLDPNIVDEVLSFPAKIKAINESIFFNVNMECEPDGPNREYTLEPLYEIAFKSIDLARRIRSSANLSNIKRTVISEKNLKETQEKFSQDQAKRRERDRLSLLELN